MSWLNLRQEIVEQFMVLAPTSWHTMRGRWLMHRKTHRLDNASAFTNRRDWARRREDIAEAEHARHCMGRTQTGKRCKRVALVTSVMCGKHLS